MERIERRIPVARQPVVVQIGLVGSDQSHDAVVQWEVIELAVDVVLPQHHAVSRRHGVSERRAEIQVGEAVHLREMRHRQRTARREGDVLRARGVALGDVNRVGAHIRDHVALPLVRRLARRGDVHLEMLDGSVGGQAHRGVTTANAREAVDLVAHDLVAAARDALDGDGIVPEKSEIAVLLGRLAGLASREGEKGNRESVHSRSLERDTAFASRPHGVRCVMPTCSHRGGTSAMPWVAVHTQS